MANGTYLLLAAGLLFVLRCVESDEQPACLDLTCNSESREESGNALLQVRADRLHSASSVAQSVMVSSRGRGAARDLLPPEIVELGIQLVGSEDALDELVLNSRFENITYSGIPMTLRMVNEDLGNMTLDNEGKQLYGFDSLEELIDSPRDQAMNMVDFGGNYGAVSIAAFKMYPTRLRAVAVEPIPSTFFFLRWNMWLNEVPALEESDLQQEGKPGVLALNRGVVTNNREVIDVCYTPPYTMIGQVCSCDSPHQWPGKQCHHVPGITTRGLFQLFGDDPITVVKLDCEGCELSSLPVLMEIVKEDPRKIRRLVGELHFPTRDLENMACRFESGQFFVRLCSTAENPVAPMPLACGVDDAEWSCERDSNNALVMEGIETALNA